MVVDLGSFLLLTADEARRFVKYLSINDQGCWIWTGGKTSGNSKSPKDRGGYGKFWLRGRSVAVHRLLYTATHGPIEDTLDHRPTCDRACCNPAHLEDVPIGVNVLRGHGVMAQHARKTHCKRGHPLAGDNLVHVPGGRMCRLCRNLSYRAYRQRKKAVCR